MSTRLSSIPEILRVLSAAFALTFSWCPPGFSADLFLFAGAGLRQPTDRLIETFQMETGHTVRVTYAGSGQLLSSILASGQGDLFMPGALFYIEKLKKMGCIDSARNLVAHTAVVGVNIHRANRIRSFDDLARPGVRLAMGDPKAMAFGRLARQILCRSPLREAILKNVVVYGATVKQLAMYVSQGDVDASIIGRADAFQFRDHIKMVPIPEEYFQPETVAIAVLKDTKHLEAASRFRDFMASEKSIAVFEHFGFLRLGEKVTFQPSENMAGGPWRAFFEGRIHKGPQRPGPALLDGDTHCSEAAGSTVP